MAAVWPWEVVAVLSRHDWSAPTSGSLSLTEIKKSHFVWAVLVSGYGFHLTSTMSADSAMVSPWFRDRVSCMLLLRLLFSRQAGCIMRLLPLLSFPVTEKHLVPSVLLFYEDGKLQIGLSCPLTLRRLMSYIYIYIYIYIYGAPILDVSRSHTTTQHSR